MSDTTDTITDPPAEPANEPEPEGTATPALPDDTEYDAVEDTLTDDAIPEPTQRALKKLRDEHKAYRETYSEYEQAFTGHHPDDAAAIRQAVAQGATDPEGFGRWMLDSAKILLGEEGMAEALGVDTAPDDTDKEPEAEKSVAEQVQEAVKAALSERDSQTEQQKAVEKIKAETEELGFGPSHRLHGALLSIARNETNGDLKAAADALRQEITTAQQNLATDEETDVSQVAVPRTGTPPQAATPTGSAEERMRARLDALDL